MPSGEDLSIGRLFGVAGKVIVVTGGSKGIGLMIASGFVQNGARVYIFSRKPAMEAAAALSARGPGSCVALQCDVADRAQIDAVAAQVGAAEPGGVHCLVNNSGATWGEPFDTTPKKSWDKLNAVNVVGLFETTQAFMPLLERSIADDGTGASARVINIASIDGMRTPQIEEYAYTATKVGRQAFSGGGAAARTAAARTRSARAPSPPPAPCLLTSLPPLLPSHAAAAKAAVLHLSRNMAGHLSSRRVNVNCISPGLFPSKMGSQVIDTFGEELISHSIPLGRAGRASDIASAALFLAGLGGAYTTGANIVVDGGVLAKL